MPNYRRANIDGATYFFTVVTYRRQRILCNDDVRIALRQGIHETRESHPFQIDAWVLLPEHLHCIWTLPAGDANFGIRWAMIKRYVSKHCTQLKNNDWLNDSKRKRNESTLWQRRFWEHLIRDERDYETHVDYIHFNPVKHGVVPAVNDWPFSTFHRYVRHGFYPEDWGGTPGQNNGGDFGE